MDASSSAVFDLLLPEKKYDVFISFKGKDTRREFTSHLYAALDQKKISTYKDVDELLEGEEIRPALLTAIEQSKLSVIIFSKDYASSRWCLDDLVHILECKEKYGQLVIPVFYDIDPSDVRRQLGSYFQAFEKHTARYEHNMDTVSRWRQALAIAANLSGFHSSNTGTEAELVEKIVEDILVKVIRDSPADYLKGLIGIESRIRQIESLLSIHRPDIRFRTIGIWGPRGIGKTTLADAIYQQFCFQFEACSFVANVREKSKTHGILHLRDGLLRELLKDETLSISTRSIGSTFVKKRLSRTKVLVVLDDVNDPNQLEFLLGDEIHFALGSRIIITARNRRLFENRVHNDYVYEVEKLNFSEALQLFQLNASSDGSSRSTDYPSLSRKMVDHAEGNPLALQVLGSSFIHCDSKELWEDVLTHVNEYLARVQPEFLSAQN